MTVSLPLTLYSLSVPIRFALIFLALFLAAAAAAPPPHFGPATICFLSHRVRDSLLHSQFGVSRSVEHS